MRAMQLASRRARLLRNALITALVPGLLINPATPLNPIAQAFMIEVGFGGDFGGGGWGDWDSGIDTWTDAAAGNEGEFPDNGFDNVPDQTDGLDGGGDEWTDPGDPDSDPAPADADGNEGDPDDPPDEEKDEGPPETPNSCGSLSAEVAGDPINLARADKVHFQVDYRGRDLAPLRASRVYHSNAGEYPARVTVPMGVGWRFFYDRSVQTLGPSQVRLHRYDGTTIDFYYSGAAWIGSKRAGNLSLVGSSWQYVSPRNDLETYDAAGRLVSVSRQGRVTTLVYDSAGRLATVTNPFGRALSLAYDAANRVNTIAVPGGGTLAYGYDAAGNLSSITFPDTAVRRYMYENPTWRNAMTGIIDETGRRIVTWGYDAAGRPNYNHYGEGINPLSVSYGAGQVTTTDARGTARSRTLAVEGGRQRVTALTVAATADSTATSTHYGFDGYGHLNRVTARSGAVNQTVNDARGRPLSITWASSSPNMRTVQHNWHSVWNIALSSQKSGITTSRTVDKNGRVIRVMRTAANGTSYVVRQRSYNDQHLLASLTNARGGVRTFGYDAQGNRTSVTNAVGQTTSYSGFDAHGRPTRIVLPSGVVVTRSYNARGRLIQQSINGVATNFTFDAAGRVAQLSGADGAWVTRQYDTTGRLSSTANHRGDSVRVGRDVAGKVISRATYNSAGTLVHATYARFDRLGRLAAQTDNRGNTTLATYGSDSRRTGTIDPLGRNFSQQLDLLNRPVVQTQPNTAAMRQAGGPATVSTLLGWDAVNGALTSVSDTMNVGTGYGFDGLNRRAAEAGKDGGARQWSRNAAGDALQYVDARGVTITITRDALGRPTQVTPAGAASISYAYVPGRSGQLLASMTDPSGSTAWTYDSEGRVLSKSQTAAAVTSQVSYARDALGRVTGMVYPSGMRVSYNYSGDTVTSITVNGVTLLSAVGYRAFSQTPTRWTWGNGSVHERMFDADGRITRVTLGSVVRSYAHDPAGRVIAYNDVLRNGGTQRSVFSYDEAGQLTAYSGPGGNFSYAYDTNGNRRSQTRNGATTVQTYATGSNRLLTSPRGTYVYQADGSPTTDGAWSFSYDAFGRMSGLSMSRGFTLIDRGFDGLGMRVRLLRQEYIPPDVNFAVSGITTGKTPGRSASRAQTRPSSGPAIQRTAAPSGSSTSLRAAVTTWSMPAPGATAARRSLDSMGAAGAVPDGPQLVCCGGGSGGGWEVTDNIRYLHADNGQLLREYNRSTGYSQETIWFAGMPVGTMINGTLLTVSADHLGTPRALARASDNAEVWRWDGEPFGDSQPTYSGGVYFEYNLRFPGQQYEPYTGYYQNWFRDYDPYTGRYLQSDPTGLGGGLSRYAYVGGNPISRVDPNGLNPLAGAYTGAGIGSAFGPVETVVGGLVGAGVGAWIGWNVVGPMLSSGLPPGFWPGDKGSAEWGRRNGFGTRDGKGRFHGIKQGCPGSKPTDNYGVDPATGDVVDPNGDVVGNLWDAKPK